jgi:hypothetical protein
MRRAMRSPWKKIERFMTPEKALGFRLAVLCTKMADLART